MDRRSLLKQSLPSVAALLIGPARRAGATSVRTVRPAVADANLVGFETTGGMLPVSVSKALKGSGLSLAKITLNGGSDYDVAIADITQAKETIRKNSDLLQLVWSRNDIAGARESGKLGVVLSFESVKMLGDDIDRIRLLNDEGVRVLQLSYNQSSVFSSGALSPEPSSGLTPLGRRAVAQMNDLGMTIDVSHSDEKAVLDIARWSNRPVIASHTGCSAIYAHPRNKSDLALRAIAEKGGFVGIYLLPFLAEGPAQPSIHNYMAHLTHALSVCGVDHVGIGSDNTIFPFDNTPEARKSWKLDYDQRRAQGIAAPDEDRVPFVEGLNGPWRYESISHHLKSIGLSDNAVQKVIGTNFERVLLESWIRTPK